MTDKVPLPEPTALPILTKAAGGCYMGKYDLHQLTSVELQRLLDNAAAVSAADNAALLETQHRFGQVQHDFLTRNRELLEASKSALLVLCALRDANDWHPNMRKDIDFAIDAARAALGDKT